MISAVTLFLAGDVMTGRGIDQILANPCDPQLHETYVKNAGRYVSLADQSSGSVPRDVDFDYIWGDALEELQRVEPAAGIVNLETSITRSEDFWSAKEVHYRMSPENAQCLTAANLDVCSLANNHVVDWGWSGFEETLSTLEALSIPFAGAGRDLAEATAPAVVRLDDGCRVLVFGLCSQTSGVPRQWAAREKKPGVRLIDGDSRDTLEMLGRDVERWKESGDIAVASLHWGPNWGYEIPRRDVEFARGLVDVACFDLVHGHSSHHVKALEVYNGKLILYGCGDLLTDYEGIRHHDEYHGDLGLMFFPRLDPATGKLEHLEMTPTRMRRFRLERASRNDVRLLAEILNREGRAFHSEFRVTETGTIHLERPD